MFTYDREHIARAWSYQGSMGQRTSRQEGLVSNEDWIKKCGLPFSIPEDVRTEKEQECLLSSALKDKPNTLR